MKRTLCALMAVSAVGLTAAPAFAQNPWVNINARQANLDRRIDMGVRNGDLTRREATQLRSEFRSLVRLEADYRRGGLNMRERADLDRRFNILSDRIRYERNDRQARNNRGWR